MNIISITGASSGRGEEFARQLDRLFTHMDEIWLIARRKERMEEISRGLTMRCRPIGLDLTDPGDMERLHGMLKEKAPVIRMLINCAGFGLMGPVSDIPLQEQKEMIRLNCVALTEMTHMCLPYMRRNSRIIQMASSAAFLPQENFAVYAATKAYVLSFSQALNQELKKQGIRVTSVCPGPVDTAFFTIAEKYGKTLAVKKLTIVPPDRVVRKALRDCRAGIPLSVCSFPIQAFHVLCKLLPHELIFCMMRLLQAKKDR